MLAKPLVVYTSPVRLMTRACRNVRHIGGHVAAALSFLIIHADGTRSALCGLPLIHPTVLCFVASPSASKQASALSIAVYDFLRGALAYVHPSDASKSADPCVRKVVQAWVDTPNPAWMPNSEIILNAGLSGTEAEKIEALYKSVGVKDIVLYGSTWICQQIGDRLRAAAPERAAGR
jgi:hypothetical protein